MLKSLVVAHTDAMYYNSDIEAVSRVANLTLRRTTHRLFDVHTQKSYAARDVFGVQNDVIIESHLNGWFYQNMLVQQGMTSLGKLLDIYEYSNYQQACFDFLINNMHFFTLQHAHGMHNERKGESERSRLSYYFHWDELWMTGLAAPWIAMAASGNHDYHDYARRFRSFIDCHPRTCGILANHGTEIRTDDAFLLSPAMVHMARMHNDVKAVELAIQQVLVTHQYLFDNDTRLYKHILNTRNGWSADTAWGRGNGWMALAFTDMLGIIPKDNPYWSSLHSAYVQQMSSLLDYQSPDGGWRQIIDDPDSWVETSCTGMFVYALATGCSNGWLDSGYSRSARRGWEVLKSRVLPDGVITDTCPSTGPGDKKHYANRPRASDNSHAPGPVLMAGSAILRLG